MEKHQINGSQVQLHKWQGNDESMLSQPMPKDGSSLSNCEIINSDFNQQSQMQQINIYNLQQKFFNVEDHNQLCNQMKKNSMEEGVPQYESFIFNQSKIKKKRASLQQLTSQENGSYSVQAPLNQKRNSFRKQPSEVLSVLSNQNLNLYNINNKNDNNILSSEYLQSQLINVNQGRITHQHSSQSFQNEKRLSKRESIMLNSNNSSLTNNNIIALNQNKDNNNNNNINNNNSNNNVSNIIIGNSNNSNYNNIQMNQIQNSNSLKQESNIALVNNGKDFANYIYMNTSFSNLKPHSMLSNGVNDNKIAQLMKIQYDREQTVSKIKKLNTFQSNKLMIQQEQEIKQRIVTNMLCTSKNSPLSNKKIKVKANFRNSAGPSSQLHGFTDVGSKHDEQLYINETRKRVKEAIDDSASPQSELLKKGQTLFKNIFRLTIMAISFKIFCFFQIAKNKKALSALGTTNFIFQIFSLFFNIFIIQYFLLKIFKTLEGSAMNSVFLDIFCMLVGQIEVVFTFIFAYYDSREMKVLYDQRTIYAKQFSRFSKYFILVLDMITFFAIVVEIIWQFTHFSIPSAVLNIIRGTLMLKLARILSSLTSLRCHFFKRQYYYHYEVLHLLIATTLLILVFTNLWCALSSYYFQVLHFYDFAILQNEHISNEDYNRQYLFFLNKVIENTFSVHTTLESDDSRFEQTLLISLQHIFIGCFYIYMFQSIFTLSKLISIVNKHKCQSQIDLIEYSKKINLKDDLLDQSILYISNLPPNPNRHSIVTHKEALKILPRSFKNEITDSFEELLFEKIPFLSQFYTSLKSKIFNHIEEITYSPDEQIIVEGQQDDCSLYFIIDGEAQVFYQKKIDSTVVHNVKTLKKLEYFGEISFLTGEYRKASVNSSGYLTVIKISRRTLINLIKDHILDYQAFCMMRDKIMNSQNYSYINLKCYICEQESHIASKCPQAHYQMDIVSFAQRYYKDSQDQVRQIHQRRKKASTKAILCIKMIQRAVSGILEDTYIQGILSEDYSSDLHLEEDELEKKLYYDSILLSLEFSEIEKENNLNNNLSKRPSQIHLPMTPDRRTSSKLNLKNGSMVASVEDDIDQVFNSNMNNEIVFSQSSINNKILIRSKTNPKDEKNSPKHKTSKGRSVSIQKADSLTNHGSRYSRSHFHQPVTLSSISHKSSKEKDDFPLFISRDDLSEKVFNFAAYYPDSNAKNIIDIMNKNHKINSINDLIIKQNSVCSQNIDISNQINLFPQLGQISFYSVPNYGPTIQNYQIVQREHQERAQRKMIDQFNQNFLNNLDDNEDYIFN